MPEIRTQATGASGATPSERTAGHEVVPPRAPLNTQAISQAPMNQSTRAATVGTSSAKSAMLHKKFNADQSKEKMTAALESASSTVQALCKECGLGTIVTEANSPGKKLESIATDLSYLKLWKPTIAHTKEFIKVENDLKSAGAILEEMEKLAAPNAAIPSNHMQPAPVLTSPAPPSPVSQFPVQPPPVRPRSLQPPPVPPSRMLKSSSGANPSPQHSAGADAGHHQIPPSQSHQASPSHQYNSGAEGHFMQQQIAHQQQVAQQQQELSNLNQATANKIAQIKALESQFMEVINSMQAGIKELAEINKAGNQIAAAAI